MLFPIGMQNVPVCPTLCVQNSNFNRCSIRWTSVWNHNTRRKISRIIQKSYIHRIYTNYVFVCRYANYSRTIKLKKHWKICDHTFRSWKRQESKEKKNNWYSVCTYVCYYPWESTTRDSKNFLICWSSALLVYSEWNNRKGVAVRKMRMHYPDAFSLSSRGDRRWWFGG